MKALVLLMSCVIALNCFSQSREDKFYSAIEMRNFAKADSMIADWTAETTDDPQLAIAKFNRYLNEARKSYIALTSDPDPKQSDALVFADSTGTAVGSFQEAVEWDDDLFNKGIDAIKSGIEKHPRRLDMRLGLAAAYNMRDMPADACSALVDIIISGQTFGNNWLLAEGETADAEDMLRIILDYTSNFFNDGFDKECNALSNAVLRYYPDDLRFINIQGALKYMQGDYDEALNLFKHALDLDPSDTIVMSNIAQVYLQTKKYSDAIEMCDKILAMPSTPADIRRFTENLKAQAQKEK